MPKAKKKKKGWKWICESAPHKQRKGYRGKCTCISKKTGNVIKVKGYCSRDKDGNRYTSGAHKLSDHFPSE
jgi:hypothetical protein